MTARRTSRVVTSALVAGACVALALTGCSAGHITQTATQVAAVPGFNVTVGSIALRNLVIEYGGPEGYRSGDNAPLIIRIFNDGAVPVTLTGVATDQAGAVTLVGGPGPIVSPSPTTPAPASPVASPSPEASPSPATSPSPDASPSPSPGAASPAPSPSPAPPTSSRLSIQIPPQSYALLVPGQGSYLQLTGLKEPVVAGDWVTATFTFDNGVSIPAQIPLVPPPGTELPRATPVVEGGHE